MNKLSVLLSTLLVFSSLSGTAFSQNADLKFVEFLIQSLDGLPAWLRQNNLDPMPLRGDGRLNLTSSMLDGTPYYELQGEIRNRYYFSSRNASIDEINSNVEALSFSLNLTYGGSDDYVTGRYNLEGSIISAIPFFGSGNFTRNVQVTDPLDTKISCNMVVTPDGYFELDFCGGFGYRPVFTNFTLEGFDALGNEWAIIPMVNSWYEAQLFDATDIFFYWHDYMAEIFAVTPIVDIIGETLPPTIKQSKRNSAKSKVKTNKPYFDHESKKWAEKVTVGY